jgi:hypothetical protein
MIEISEWLTAARAIRDTCGNVDEFDRLIMAQEKRRLTMSLVEEAAQQ